MELEELQHFGSDATRAIARHDRVIVVTDLLGARVFPPPVADAVVALIRHDGPKVERNAFLVGESAVFSMQIERIIRDSGAHGRRSFRRTTDLEQWLADSMTRVERA